MPKFSNTTDLMAYIRQAVDTALETDVFPTVREAELQAVDDVVYSLPTSGYYRRRGEYEGLGDPNNIVMMNISAAFYTPSRTDFTLASLKFDTCVAGI